MGIITTHTHTHTPPPPPSPPPLALPVVPEALANGQQTAGVPWQDEHHADVAIALNPLGPSALAAHPRGHAGTPAAPKISKPHVRNRVCGALTVTGRPCASFQLPSSGSRIYGIAPVW